MLNNTSLLVLRLEGVLQSWGEDAKWDTRGSASFPTKSGIVGLLACAMGLERGDPRIADLSERISVTVRADRPGEKVEDYQTVTGNPLRTAGGGKRSLGNTFISRRTYLQDASFLVVIATAPALHEQIVNALKQPTWSVFLGRRSCVPSRPVLECAYPVQTDPLELIRTYPTAERTVFPVPFETDVSLPDSANHTRPDIVKPGYRNFERRHVWCGTIEEIEYVPDKN